MGERGEGEGDGGWGSGKGTEGGTVGGDQPKKGKCGPTIITGPTFLLRNEN